MGKYNKLWAAIASFVVLGGMRYYEISLPGYDEIVLDLLVSALGAFGVYQVPNRG